MKSIICSFRNVGSFLDSYSVSWIQPEQVRYMSMMHFSVLKVKSLIQDMSS